MATAAVHTPVKSHSNIFSSKHAGGRVPLTPSPRTRAVANHSPFTPPAPARRDPEWQAEKKKQGNASRGSLHDTFSSMSLSTTKRSTSPPPAAKASAATSASPPLRLDLGLSDWNLPGASKPTTLKKARSAKPTKSTVRINGDRFIPSRSATSPTAAMKANHTRPGSRSSTHDCANSSDDVFGPDNSNQSSGEECEDYTSRKSPKSKAYEASIAEAVGLNLGTRILAFKPAPPESSKPIDLRTQYNRPLKSTISAQTRRRILTAPERVLDAPGLLDDYYLNLLDWGSSNQVAIGLERNVYVWNAETGSVSCLLETTPDTYVSSVRWSQDGSYVSVGLGTGDVQIWDVEEGTKSEPPPNRTEQPTHFIQSIMPGNFHATAEDIKLKDGHKLECHLRNSHGHMVKASIDLNDYIGNSDGWFLWNSKDFSHSARDVQLVFKGDGPHLEGQLPMRNGGYRERQGINLAHAFDNHDGCLVYIPQP